VAPSALSAFVAAAAHDGMDAWIRDVDDTHPVVALGEVSIQRRLRVLERSLDEPIPPPRAAIEDFSPDRDHEALVRLLADAYAGTPDGWDPERVALETARPTFAPADILVALSIERPGELDGAHWTLRRDKLTGEVHNLSVHPSARGRGLADDLLVAGLVRLQEAGCERVILWVDADNEPGRRLYTRRDFTTAWVDALVRLPNT
jgi:mycothiol synthase